MNWYKLSQTTYFKGDMARFTGNRQTLHGQEFHEVEMLEGVNKGQKKLVKKQQEQFSRTNTEPDPIQPRLQPRTAPGDMPAAI